MAELLIGDNLRGTIVGVGVRPFGYIASDDGAEFFFPFANVADAALLGYLQRLQRRGTETTEPLIPVTFVNGGKRFADDEIHPTAVEVRAVPGWSPPE